MTIAPSQAHLQGTQSLHTDANLAKEPALFQRFRDTLRHGGHIPSIQITNTKGEHTTGGFMQVGQDIVTSANCKFQLQSGQTNNYRLLYLSSSIYFQSAAVMGRRNSNSQPA